MLYPFSDPCTADNHTASDHQLHASVKFHTSHKLILWLCFHCEIGVCFWVANTPTSTPHTFAMLVLLLTYDWEKILTLFNMGWWLSFWRFSTIFFMWPWPPHSMISNIFLTALAEEESASCQWMATSIPSSLALWKVTCASADLEVPG